MQFEQVVIAGLAHVEAPHRVPSSQFEDRLAPVCDRLGIRKDMLTGIAGIEARRWWDPGTTPSQAATLAVRKVIDEAGVDPARIGQALGALTVRALAELPAIAAAFGDLCDVAAGAPADLSA